MYIAVKAGTPSDYEVEVLSTKLEKKWEKLGRLLKFEKPRITAYDSDNNKLEEKAYNMLMDWKQREGNGATYQVLYNALCHHLMDCRVLAEQFCCKGNQTNIYKHFIE